METKKLTIKDYLKSLGPGAIMAAAIIGPGTVTTASTQGANYGYASLWLILLACVIAYFFQEPATGMSTLIRTNFIRSSDGTGLA